ncbi:MAG: IPT/TIG domain-containing protein [candidate division Zixibacteria bacterium]|nr:IPT/TIG domain-containing protein [candidate division Zixibacteria bacterium]MBU1469351.1 IPT/TIG domain-containing protein [candidate division Zixibacteria bacterium]MBU2623960.1 IPT/TIG domain-containing protein [candidate division Zixibacteria bacterium]
MKSQSIVIKGLGEHRKALLAVLILSILTLPSAAFAQGSIFGSVQNSDVSTPANGDISFVGFLDDTDEEIRIETSDGAGYDTGNWFDDFQNYQTEAAGNPYDYYFHNSTNGEAYHLAKLIPINSFQQEDIVLEAASLPSAPTGLAATALSTSSMLVSWTGSAGLTYHVYRRNASSNGSLFRLDNTAGSLSDPGVSETYFVDNTTDGVSSYVYVLIAEDVSGNYSPHSAQVTGNSAAPAAPAVTSLDPATGVTIGGTFVSIYGSEFDPAGVGVTFGGVSATSITVVSPYHVTANTPAGTSVVDVTVTNTASTLSGTLPSAFTYYGNSAPIADAGPDQLGQFKTTLITLDGSASSDIDLDILGYHWKQISGPEAVVLSDSNVVDPSFTVATNGDYFFELLVDDAIDYSDPDTVRVEVVERAPVLAAIGSQIVTEGANLNVGVSASDPDGTTPSLTAENVPINATFTDNGDGTGTFDFNPDFTQAGTYSIRFIASDGVLADTEIVAITVNDAGNQAPVLAAIGSQVVDENVNLNFGVSASDPDATTPALTAEDIPANATFTDNGDGTGTFDFTPDYTQAGPYSVRFIASDGALADTEIVAITVNDAGNQRPVLAAIGAQIVDEGANLNFAVSASDPDGTIPTLTAKNIPTNGTFTDNGDGSGSFDFNPGFTQSGVYNVIFIASDVALADTEIVQITVTDAGNQAPILAAIGSQVVDEGANLNVGISATDPDGTTPALTALDVPVNATFTDNGNGTGTFDFNPSFIQAGPHSVTFIASDGIHADTEVVAITVNEAGNQSPILVSIGSQIVDEGANLNFGVSASDPDGSTPALTAENVPTNATFTDNGDGTGIFDFNPDFTQAGPYNIRFIASDGALADTEIVAITVYDAGNQAPVLAAIGSQIVNEGANLTFGVSASDPDATVPALTAEDVPANATFTDNGDGTGTFDFNPDFTQAGPYSVRFIASDGVLADTEIVSITVNDAGNQAPVLAAIGSQLVDEGANLNVGISASDPDGTIPALTAEDVPANATFTDNGDGTGTFDFNPDFTQAGPYSVRFIASDGALADTEVVAITVDEAGNQAPVLAAIGAQNVDEGANLNVGISASDPDGTIPVLTAEDVPLNATFTDNGNGTGLFDFNPDFIQAGIYNVRFIASDGALADTEVVAVTVNDAGNQAPVLAAIGSQVVDEGANLNIGISATDPDATIPTLTAEDVPTNATFLDNGDGTGTFDFNPDFTQAGPYSVRFIASDGALADTEIVSITVYDAGNQAPILAAIGSQLVDEGANLNFGVTASDPDGSIPSLTAEDVPTNATFTDNGDGTGTFDFNPGFTQAGPYNVRFIASDGALADTEVVAITVNEAGNQSPVLAAIGAQVVDEGANLNFGVSASDADATIPSLTAEDVPVNATFTDNGNGTGTFDFNPDFTQAGPYNVRFIASDGALADTEIVAITVNDAGNQSPVLAAIGAQAVDEGANLNFGVSASDPDGTTPALTAEDVPTNAIFTDNGDGTGIFDFNPDFLQNGTYNVRFIASDGALADTEIVSITVNEAGNQAPVLATIGSQLVDEGANLNFVVSASDPDATIPALTAEDIPTNATFIDNGDGTGTFDFNPDFTQAGPYNVRFIASDGALADTEIVAITVNDAGNQAPVLAAIGPQLVDEGTNLNFGVSATDVDGTVPALTAEDIPINATFIDNGDGTGTFDFNPDFAQAGLFSVRFIASDGALADTEIVAITVNDAGNQAPVLAAIGPQVVDEGANLNVGVSASDPDATIPALTAENVPTNAAFVDNGDGTGTFDFNPSYLQAGVYSVRVIASDGALADSEDVQITVVDAGNQAPDVVVVDSQFVDEGANLNFAVSATDPDSTIPALTAQNLPTNATFVDNGDGTGTFDFNPSFAQVGEYTVLFEASDGALTDIDSVVVTVNDVNQPPTLDPIGPRVINPGYNLNFVVTSSDPDSTYPTLTAANVPLNASFTDLLNGTGAFNFTPDSSQVGNHLVTFVASDGVFADTEVVTINVNLSNMPPVITAITPKTVAEGGLLEFVITATDPEGHGISLYIADPFENAVLADSGNGHGLFTYQPSYYQAGIDTVKFLAIDDGNPPAAGTRKVIITTTDVNRPPTFRPIPPQSVLLGDSLMLRLVATDSTDADGGPMFLSAIKKPLNSTFVDSGNGIGGLKYIPVVSQVGVDTARFVCFDDEDPALSGIISVEITTVLSNQPPVLAPIGPKVVTEGDTLQFNVYATDPDGPFILLYTGTLPRNATFVDSGNGVGTFTFMPDFVQSGLKSVKFTASDGMKTDYETVLIQIYDNPQAPIITVSSDTTFTEGEILEFLITAIDPDSTTPGLRMDTIVTAPYATFVDSGNGNGGFRFAPVFVQAGIYDFSFIAFDESGLADTGVVTVTVLDAGNQSPLFMELQVDGLPQPFEDTIFLKERDVLEFELFTTDADSVPPLISGSPIPSTATFTDNLDFTASFSWETSYSDSGVYDIRFYAVDGVDPLEVDSVDMTIVIANDNRPPFVIRFEKDGDIWPFPYHDDLNEGETGVYDVEMIDPDSVSPILRLSRVDYDADTLLPLPANVVVTDEGNNFGSVTFSPNYFQSSTTPYVFRVFAKDAEDTTLYIQKDFEVTVHDLKQNPVLDPIPTPIVVTEGDSVNLVITYTDADSPPTLPLTLLMNPVLENAGINVIDQNSADFHFYPWFDQAGDYLVVFQVRDFEFKIDTQTVLFQVLEAGPQPPILYVPFAPMATVNLGSAFNQRIYSIDPEGDAITLSAINMPLHSSFVDSTNGAGSFYFDPDATQANFTYFVTFISSDGTYDDSVTVEFFVQEFVCGDVDGSGDIDIDDVVYLIAWIFTGGPYPEPLIAADVHRTDCPLVVVDIDDVTHLVSYIFTGGAPPNCDCP